MGDFLTEVELLLKADAELAGMLRYKAELAQVLQLAADSGKDTAELEKGIEAINKKIGERSLDVWEGGLTSAIAKQKELGQSTAELETQLDGVRQARALPELTQDAEDAAASAQKLGGEAKHTAENLHKAQQAGQAVSQLLAGDFVGAARSAATALKGMTALVASNPFTAFLAALPLVIGALTFGYRKATEDLRRSQEEAAQNSEVLAARIEASLRRVANVEFAERIIEQNDRVVASMQRVQRSIEQVLQAENRLKEAQAQKKIADIDAAEQSALRAAMNKGATPEQLDNIRADFSGQRAAAQSQAAQEAAQRDVDTKQRGTENLEKQLALLAAALEKILAGVAERDSVRQSFVEQSARQVEDLKKLQAEQQVKTDAARKAFTGDPGSMSRLQEEQRKQKEIDDRVADAEQRHKNAVTQRDANAGKPDDKESGKYAQLQEQIADLKRQIEASKIDLEAAKVKQATTGAQAAASNTKQGIAQDEHARTQKQAKDEKDADAAEQRAMDATERGLQSGKLAPTKKRPGESDKDFKKRQADYQEAVGKAQAAIEDAGKDGKYDDVERDKIIELLERLAALVDDSQRGNVNAQVSKLTDLDRRVSLLEQQKKNTRPMT